MNSSTPRILLLTTHRSYRNDAFRQAAERIGVEVTLAFDMRQELAADWHYTLGVDFDRPEEAAAAIVAYAGEHPLAAVLAVDDSGVVLAAGVAQQLGLPYNDPAAASAARDKFRMRTLMAARGVPCPWFRRFSTTDDPIAVAGEVPYPCVLKPLHLNGSRGVIRADNPAGFVAAAQRLARILQNTEPEAAAYPYLVEAFIPGGEVALEGMLEDGELIVLALFDKPDPLDGPFFEETLYVTPSRLPAAEQAAIAARPAQAARAIGLAHRAGARRAARQRAGAVAAGGQRPLHRRVVRTDAALRPGHVARGADPAPGMWAALAPFPRTAVCLRGHDGADCADRAAAWDTGRGCRPRGARHRRRGDHCAAQLSIGAAARRG